MKNIQFPLLLAALLLSLPSGSSAAQVMLEKAVVTGGTVRASNPSTVAELAAGQAVVGYASNGQTRGTFGVWHDAFVASSVDDRTGAGSIAALQVSPNPARERATIGLTLRSAGQVEVTLHDQMGRQVATLFSGQHAAGELRVPLDPTDLPSGTYHIAVQMHGALLQGSITIFR